MAYFTDETLAFWRGLAKNNNKVWFDKNRAAYEKHLKAPYRRLAEDLVYEIADREPEYELEPAKATYRINRDIRFSKDKTPYKTELGVTLGRREKHDLAYPAYTVRVGIHGVSIAGGMYAPERALRDFLREYVGNNSASLMAVLNAQPFANLFGGIQADNAKRIPKHLAVLAETEPLVYNKQWVYWCGYDDPELLLSDDLGGFIIDHWDAARPVNEYFKAALHTRLGQI